MGKKSLTQTTENQLAIRSDKIKWCLSRSLERTHTYDTLHDEKDFPPEDYRRSEEVRKQHTLE